MYVNQIGNETNETKNKCHEWNGSVIGELIYLYLFLFLCRIYF